MLRVLSDSTTYLRCHKMTTGDYYNTPEMWLT